MSQNAASSSRPHPRRSSRGRAAWWLLLVLLLVVAAAATWGAWQLHAFARAPLRVPQQGATLEVARGESFRGVVRQLRRQQFTAAPDWKWRALVWKKGVAQRLHAGEYELIPGISPSRLLDDLAAGRVLHRRVTLVDGWTFAQVRQALQGAPRLVHELTDLSDPEVMAKLGAAGQSPEGVFMPDTYDYVLGMSDIDVLRRAHTAMQQYLAQAWATRDRSIWIREPYQALILASLVERECRVPAELPQIAGVFERRLRIGMKLDTDPSVIFGLGDAYTGRLHKKDLKTLTPYNTYMRAGLTPTPIALPGRGAIYAVLHPAAGNALYFVARGDGSHKFSASLAEHNAAVRKYILGKSNP